MAKSHFGIFLNNKNKKYKIDCFYPASTFPYYVWKLTILGPKNTLYYGGEFDFKIDFSKPFRNITDIITIETGIYHLNFSENGMLLFDKKIDGNKSFYENLTDLFDFLYNLFVKPNCEISKNLSRTKIDLYKKNIKLYNENVEKAVYTMKINKGLSNLYN